MCVFVIPRLLIEYRESLLIFNVSDLALFCIPGAFSLLFVRKQVLFWWSFSLILFFVVASDTISQANSYAGWWGASQRDYATLSLGIFFSIFTILWAIIHTLILRHKEKKVGQTMTK